MDQAPMYKFDIVTLGLLENISSPIFIEHPNVDILNYTIKEITP